MLMKYKLLEPAPGIDKAKLADDLYTERNLLRLSGEEMGAIIGLNRDLIYRAEKGEASAHTYRIIQLWIENQKLKREINGKS